MSKITTKQLAIIIPGIGVVSIKTYPTLFTGQGGRDTWISVIVASILIIAFILYIFWICKKRNCFNIVDIYHTALGKSLGTVFLAVFGVTVLLSLVESATVEANAMHTNFLLYTQPWWFMLLSVIIGLLIVKNVESVVTVGLVSLIFISSSGVILALLTEKNKEYKYLQPILEDGITSGFLLSIVKLLGAYGCVIIILLYAENLKDTKKLGTHMLLGMLFLVELQIYSMIGTICTFSEERLNHLIYPKLIQTQMVSQFGFLEAGELFVMFQIVAGWFLKYVLVLFALTRFLELMGQTKRFIPYIVSVIVIVASYYANKNLLDLFTLLNWFVYIELVNYILLPAVIFTIFYLRLRKPNMR